MSLAHRALSFPAAELLDQVPIDRGGRRRLFPVQAPVDLADLLHPPSPVGVLQVQDLVEWPVEMIGQVGYLLVELVERVAYDPPGPFGSTAN
jgi:hypothetical protein